MPVQTDLAPLSLRQLLDRLRPEIAPLNVTFSYGVVALPLSEEDAREYLAEPVASLPPEILALLPKIIILLAPYLTEGAGKEKTNGSGAYMVHAEKPTGGHELQWAVQKISAEEFALVFAIKDQDVADYHYRFYHLIAALVADRLPQEAQSLYGSLLQEELNGEVHGEVDEESWHLKQALSRRPGNVRRNTRAFAAYLRQSFIDTITLYLHGICCDIDVETGPRQLPSRYLRKRLQLFRTLFPPPQGYAVFPEEMRA